MHAPGLDWRGATSAPFPGYMLIGRGPDFAKTLTSAGGDIIDQYVETLCGGDDTKYMYKGTCRDMTRLRRRRPQGHGRPARPAVTFLRTVHGPVIGYATVDGARSRSRSKRSSYGRDTLDQLPSRTSRTGRVQRPKTFIGAFARSPQTFNAFYIDDHHIAEVHDRPAADPRRRTSTRACRPTATATTSGAASCAAAATRRRSTRRAGRSSTGTTTSRAASAPPTTSGAAGVEPPRRPAQPEPRPAGRGGKQDARLGHVGDERRGDAGRARRRHGAAARRGCCRARPRPARGPADARPARRVERRAAAAASTATSTARSTTPARRSWTPRGRRSPTRSWARCSGRTSTSSPRSMPRSTSRRCAVPRLVSVLRQGPARRCSATRRPRRSRTVLRRRRQGDVPADAVGGARRGGHRRSRRRRARDPSAWRADANAERIKFMPGLLPTTIRYTNRPTASSR